MIFERPFCALDVHAGARRQRYDREGLAGVCFAKVPGWGALRRKDAHLKAVLDQARRGGGRLGQKTHDGQLLIKAAAGGAGHGEVKSAASPGGLVRGAADGQRQVGRVLLGGKRNVGRGVGMGPGGGLLAHRVEIAHEDLGGDACRVEGIGALVGGDYVVCGGGQGADQGRRAGLGRAGGDQGL